MAVNIAATAIAKVYRGATELAAIYVGSAKVWPTFARQRMVKSGTYSGSTAASDEKMTGWVSDATYPCAIASDKLRVTGSGPATVSLRYSGSTGSGSVKVWRNGIQIGSNYTSAGTYNITGLTLAEGDLIHVTLMSYSPGTFPSGDWIEVIPA